MPFEKPSLPLADALADVLQRTHVLDAEIVPLEAAVGRALATSVSSPIDLPRWNNSGMDGYAVRVADVEGASPINPMALPVIGTIVAGGDVELTITPGVAARIMTGARMPDGADAVVRVEDTDRGVQNVRITNDRDVRSPQRNVRLRGDDLREGAHVFSAGTTVTATTLGVLASIGAATVRVHRQPRVTVVSTGDELVRVDAFDDVLAGRRIVSSSSYMLPPWLAAAGANVRALPILRDTLAGIRDGIADALAEGCDLLITTGGVSVGAHDYTRDALLELGADVAMWRARIRPGGPIGVGKVRDTLWLGLPGNPVSTMVTAELFARPVIRKLGGHASLARTTVPVRAGEAFKTVTGLTHLLRVIVRRATDGALEAVSAGGQASNQLRAMADANALLVIPETRDGAQPGDVLDAMLLGDIV